MSTAIIVGIITIGLFLLVAVAITLQTIEKNNKEKRRLESALNARARNFEYMLGGFPEGFLNPSLQILVCKCLEEVFSQLVQTNPKNREYTNKHARAQQRLAEYQAKPAANTSVTLTDREQIKEVQKMLSGLFNFISKLAANKRISGKQATAYAKQVRRLMVQSSNDALIEPIQEAIGQGKLRLAIHYMHTANEKLKKENDDGFFTEQIRKFDARINELDEEASNNEASLKERRDKAGSEWDELDKPDDTWKKKAIYD